MSLDRSPAGPESNANPRQTSAGVNLALPPAFDRSAPMAADHLRRAMRGAVEGWLAKTPSKLTRVHYGRDLGHFLDFLNICPEEVERLAAVLPADVARWRDALQEKGLSNATVRRKLTTLRSLFSYLQVYGYTGANPAHSKFVAAPSVSRDGKTVGLSPTDCRRLLEAPDLSTPVGIRDRALMGVLAYSACRVGELVKLKIGDLQMTGEHRVLRIYGKGGKERTTPLHLEAVERLMAWVAVLDQSDDRAVPLFRPARSPRGNGWDGFADRPMTTRAVEYLVERYVRALRLDPAVTVHSLRVTALTTARERGSDILDLQDFAGHSDPRTTLSYIRSRDRLSKSPTYILHY